jgi:hypothetical protein
MRSGARPAPHRTTPLRLPLPATPLLRRPVVNPPDPTPQQLDLQSQRLACPKQRARTGGPGGFRHTRVRWILAGSLSSPQCQPELVLPSFVSQFCYRRSLFRDSARSACRDSSPSEQALECSVLRTPFIRDRMSHRRLFPMVLVLGVGLFLAFILWQNRNRTRARPSTKMHAK